MNPPATTQRVLYDVARRAGYIPKGDDVNLDPEKAQEILGYMDDRLQECWEMYDFVETTMLEQRAFRPDWDPELCYPAGAIVWDSCSQQYYQALAQTVGGPLANTLVWQANPSSVSPRYIPWWTPGKNPIGTAFGAWTKNPYEDASRIRIQYFVSMRGLEFTATSNVAFVWLLYRIPYPGIGRDEWSAATTYNKGDAVIDGEDTYICSVDNTLALEPSATPANWTVFRIPWPMKRYVIQAAFSDTLVTDGQNEKAPGELSKAFSYLQEAFDQQMLQQGQRENWQGYAR
jgi:hypothetical protein